MKAVNILKDLDKIVVVGDRVVIRPTTDAEKSSGGLYLPPGVAEKEKVQSGYIIKTGPGYAIPTQSDDEPWKEKKESVRYIPLQIKEGDLALYLRKEAIEIEYGGEKLHILSQSSVLLVVRDDFIF